MTHFKKIAVLVGFALITQNTVFGQQYELFKGLMQEYRTIDGRIDYERIKEDPALQDYIDSFEDVDLNMLSAAEKMTYWINLYNVGTLQLAAEHYPAKGITKQYSGGLLLRWFWKRDAWEMKKVKIRTGEISLRDIKKELLKYSEPRIAFILFHPYLMGPKLYPQPFNHSTIEETLEKASQDFWNNNNLNNYEFENRNLRISGIVKIHRDFFPSVETEFVEYILKVLDASQMRGYEVVFYGEPKNIRESMIKDLKANPKRWDIVFKPYELQMNGL